MIDTNTFTLINLISDVGGIYYNNLIRRMLLHCDMYHAETVKSLNDCLNNNYVNIDADGLVTLTDLGVRAKSEYLANEIHYLKLRSTAF